MKILKNAKKLYVSVLVLSVTALNVPAFATEFATVEKPAMKVEKQAKTFYISEELKKELKYNIQAVYGAENTDVIYNRIEKLAAKSVSQRPKNLLNEDVTRVSDWYKDEIIYMFYVDQFGVITPGKPNSFKDSVQMLDYLKDLGVTTLYILPFADSPMDDSGFDVKNPKNVRKDLGGMPEFKEFVIAAKQKGFKIKQIWF